MLTKMVKRIESTSRTGKVTSFGGIGASIWQVISAGEDLFRDLVNHLGRRFDRDEYTSQRSITKRGLRGKTH